jgi:hypothetical protein
MWQRFHTWYDAIKSEFFQSPHVSLPPLTRLTLPSSLKVSWHCNSMWTEGHFWVKCQTPTNIKQFCFTHQFFCYWQWKSALQDNKKKPSTDVSLWSRKWRSAVTLKWERWLKEDPDPPTHLHSVVELADNHGMRCPSIYTAGELYNRCKFCLQWNNIIRKNEWHSNCVEPIREKHCLKPCNF